MEIFDALPLGFSGSEFCGLNTVLVGLTATFGQIPGIEVSSTSREARVQKVLEIIIAKLGTRETCFVIEKILLFTRKGLTCSMAIGTIFLTIQSTMGSRK